MSNFRPAQRNCWLCFGLSTFAIALFLMLLSRPAITASARDGSVHANGQIMASQAAPTQWRHLEDGSVGFSLYYPADWSVDGQVIATQFAVDARCRSVRMIDFEPPSDSGAAAPMEQSFVQVCAKPLEQTDSLDQYMRRVYGESLNQTFMITDLNETRTYQTTGLGQAKTIFAETRNSLIQIIASVATLPEKLSERQAQVERILGSLMLI